MPDYQKSKVYKLWSPSKNIIYYGSTVETISQRLAKHKCKFKVYNLVKIVKKRKLLKILF